MGGFPIPTRQRNEAIAPAWNQSGALPGEDRMDHNSIMGATETESEVTAVEETPGFDQLGLADSVAEAVARKGYTIPTEIQEKAIPLVVEGRDVIGASQTGTGKTAAFCLPVLTRLREHGKTRCLILEPTRELAQQVSAALDDYGHGTGLTHTLVHGGVGYGKQRKDLTDGVDIVVATPGRLIDHLQQRTFHLKDIETLILDEVDRMLDMGFLPDVRRIVRLCPKQRQTLLFSATVPREIRDLASWVLKDPVDVSIGGGTSPAETVSHAMYPVDDRQKFDLLVRIMEEMNYRSVIIFTRTKVGADIVARWLEGHSHTVAVLHSDRSQKERDQALAGFKDGTFDVLVATDIVARGIDIATVSHVINYDIPQHAEDYVHRIGRTGRMRREGDAVTLYTAAEVDFLRSIERFIGREIEKKRVEGFDYRWTPILENQKPLKKKRNRGYQRGAGPRFGRR